MKQASRRRKPVKLGSFRNRKITTWAGALISAAGILAHCTVALGRLRRDRRRLKELMDNAADAFFVHDAKGRILEANQEACRSLGYEKEELLSLNVADVELGFSPEELGEHWEEMRHGISLTLEGVHRRKDGSTFPVEVRLGRLDADGERLMFAIARDTSVRKKAEEALRESERRFRQLFENSVDALFIHDERGKILECNAAALEALGYVREELLGLTVRDITVEMLSEEEREARAGDTLWERVMRGEPGKIVGFDQNELRRKDGTTFPVEVGVGSIEYGGRQAIFASARDITARRKLEEELRHRALHDDLTGLPNRTLFMDRLDQSLVQLGRRESYVAVLFVDLDRFKAVNDSLGHEAGDRLLVSVARHLSECIRAGDTLARLGGDEFTVLLEDLNVPEEAALVAERMIEVLGRPFEIRDQEVSVTASIGISCSSSPDLEGKNLLNLADRAMYRAKEKGRYRYEFQNPPG